MDAFTPGNWLTFFQILWLLGVTAAVSLRKPGTDAVTAVAALKDACARQDQLNAAALAAQAAKCELLQERIGNLPTHGDIRGLIQNMAEIKGDMSAVRQAQVSQGQTLTMIQEFLHSNK